MTDDVIKISEYDNISKKKKSTKNKLYKHIIQLLDTYIPILILKIAPRTPFIL